MREITNNGVTLSYPDEIGFAFNPCLLVASGDELVKMTIDIRAGEKKETIWMSTCKPSLILQHLAMSTILKKGRRLWVKGFLSQ